MKVKEQIFISELKIFSEVAGQMEDSITFALNKDGDASKMYA